MAAEGSLALFIHGHVDADDASAGCGGSAAGGSSKAFACNTCR